VEAGASAQGGRAVKVAAPEARRGPLERKVKPMNGTTIPRTSPARERSRHRLLMRQFARSIRWLDGHRHWWLLDLENRRRGS
jgi:hypothetical protein